ncbi:MAG TPA: glycosyltransferase family 39 protein [Anaerolineae bacterium]|nr:glycosyltransferase family 39 protein [Anaerolineae bacterium]
MDNIVSIVLIVVTAIALDTFLILSWRKRREKEEEANPLNAIDADPPDPYSTPKEEAPDPSSAPEEASPDPSQMQFTFDLTEGEKIQFTIEAPLQEVETKKATRSRFRVTLDTIEGQLPAKIELNREVKPISRSVIRWFHSVISQITSGSEHVWEAISKSQLASDFRKIGARLFTWAQPLELTLFSLSIFIYALTHLIGLEDFPIYFFTDEAVQANLAADFIRDDFQNYGGVLFPTYFENDFLYNLSVSVYVQILPFLMFGKSVFVTRATSVFFTITAAVAIGLILKRIFNIRYWWVGTLLLSITPAWFLHSRTAFETSLFVSFYTWFLYFYLLYRTRSPRALHLALLFGGLAFYSYSAGQLVIAGTGIILLFSDLRYHWKNRRNSLIGLGVLALLVIPYIRFQLSFSNETYYHLRMLDSYWLHDISLNEKISIFLENFKRGLDPGYWYFPNNHDLVRHLMKDYGHILKATLPFAFLGLVISLKSFRSSPHRAALTALIVSPLGGSIVGIGITRVLSFVIPAAILTALGLESVARWIDRRLTYSATAIVLFVLLSYANVSMLQDALLNGPTWYHDYELGGMQYGARQVFAEVEDFVQQDPESRVFISPTWANGAHILQQFFLSDQPNVHMGNAGNYLLEMLDDLDEETVFVLTPAEYGEVMESDKVAVVKLERTVPYPDGRDGFYFVRLRYTEDAEEIFEEEREARRQPITDEVLIEGQMVQIQHPLLDMGEVENLFDDDVFTMVRTYEANPVLIVLSFPTPRSLNGLSITTGTMDILLTVRLFNEESSEPVTYHQTFTNLPNDPTVELVFNQGSIEAGVMEVEIYGLLEDPGAKIHIREITLY